MAVSTEPGGGSAARTERPGLAQWLSGIARSDRPMFRFVRYAGSSAVATLASQLTLAGLYWLGGTPAGLAGVLAFVAGAVPNYLLNRYWTWRRTGRPPLRGELLPYLAVIIANGLVAVALTSVVGSLLEPMVHARSVRALLLAATYQSSYAAMFVVKFAMLDRLVFRHRRVVDGCAIKGPARTPATRPRA
jgi:putative flippase GtrA